MRHIDITVVTDFWQSFRQNLHFYYKITSYFYNGFCSSTLLMVGGFRFEALLALLEENNVSSAVRCGTDRLFLIVHVGIHASEILISLSLLMLLGWSLMWVSSLTLLGYQWGFRSINVLVPKQIMSGLIGVFWNGWGLGSWKPYIAIVLLNPFMHASFCFANVYFSAFARNLIHCLPHLILVIHQHP